MAEAKESDGTGPQPNPSADGLIPGRGLPSLRAIAKSAASNPRLLLNPLLLLAFSIIWIRDFLYWIPTDAFGKTLNYWAFTDWLIDYSQGFIRRGLSGELWRLVPASVSPLEFVAVLSWCLILAMVFGYVRLLARSWKTIHPLTLFGLLFLPSLFMFYLHDHNGIARKEILGYGTLLLHLYVIERSFPAGAGSGLPEGSLRTYGKWMIPLAVILLPAIILVHEGNFLLFVPLHGMITMTVLRMNASRRWAQTAVWTGLLYLPAALAFGAVYLAGTPSYQTLLGICEKWAALGAIREGSCHLPPELLSGSTLPASFIPMQWTMAKAAGITQFFISKDWQAWVLILPALGVCLWYLVRQTVYGILRARSAAAFSPQSAAAYARVFFWKYFFFPFLLSLPVYFTAYDYGRWFTVLCINYTLVAISINLPCWEFAFRGKRAAEPSAAGASREHLDAPILFYGISILLCVLAVVLWLPHYCLFSCEIIRNPLEYFSHTFVPR